MVNGAFFVASGEGVEVKYEKAYSVEPKSAVLIDQLIMHAGVLGVGGRLICQFPSLSWISFCYLFIYFIYFVTFPFLFHLFSFSLCFSRFLFTFNHFLCGLP